MKLGVHFRIIFGLLWLLGFTTMTLSLSTAYAGWQDDENESHYIEAWVDHKYYTAGCGANESSGNSWYLEPCGNETVAKIVQFYLPGLDKVQQIVAYFDQWNVRAPEDVRFRINDGPAQQSTAGIIFSRTQYIGVQDKQQFIADGDNILKFWRVGSGNTYHIHDVSFRLYYDPGDPPVTGLGPLNADLISVGNGAVTHAADSGGDLNIDGDNLRITVDNVSPDVDVVEVYAYYDGYDEDNQDGPIDWHSRNRNNCHQGAAGNRCVSGDAETGLYGTVDHVGSIDTTSHSAPYTLDWDVSMLEGQGGVKFKLRAIDIDVDLNGDGKVNGQDNADNVRNGPVSAPFSLTRDKAVLAFTIDQFAPSFIQSPDTAPDAEPRCANTRTSADYTIFLPPDTTSFDTAFLVASHYNNPNVSINGNPPFLAFVGGSDVYALAERSINVGQLQAGANTLTYQARRTCPNGEFVEAPGPMIVLKRTAGAGSDTIAPWAHDNAPADGASSQSVDVPISVQVYDSNTGVDLSTVRMRIDTGSGFNDVTNAATVTGSKFNYRLAYRAPGGLPAGATVRVWIDADDLAGNSMNSYQWTFATAGSHTVISDDFNQCELNAGLWGFANPGGEASYYMTGDGVSITVPAGVEHNLWSNNQAAPRLYQAIDDGAFDLELKFEGGFSQATVGGAGTQMHGLVVGTGIAGDSGTFVRLNVEYNGSKIRLYYAAFENGSVVENEQIPKSLSGTTPPAYFRLARVGSDWTFYWSDDGQWSAGNSYQFTRALTVSQAGVFVGNAGDNPAHAVVLDHFFNHASPIDPEDPVANILEVETTGAGSGQIERDRYCGNPVTLTAVPDAGSRFVGWSGAVNSTDPQVTVAFDRNDTVTAEFEFDGYVVTVDVIDTNGQTTERGTVTVSPPTDPKGYQLDEIVTLSATPSSGWTFFGWQGDLTGTDNPAQIVIDSSKMIEAVFGRFVTLAVTATPADGGTVNASLPGPQYVAGTQLELTAVPADGYMFTGWSGDATGTDPVLSLTMDADRTVIANFGRAYALTVITEGQGQVSPAPQDAGYPAGTVVSLTATPAGGYGLVGWDLDGDDQVDSTDASIQVIMDGDKSVKAIFRRLYSLTLSAINGQIVAEPAQTTFFEGDTVVLTPLPASGYAFVGWTGDMSGNAQPAMLEMTGEDTSKEIGAVFAEGYGIVILPPEGMGTVTLDPSTQPYAFGAVVTVTAEPAPDWEFVGWEGDLTGSANPAKITMTGEKQIRALFRAREYRLNLTIPLGMNGQVAVDPTGPYAYNQMVRLTAVPDPGWLFTGWFGDITGTELTVVVTMKANIDVSAHFAREADHTAYLPFVRRP